MEPVSLALGVIPVVVEAYKVVETAYDFYLGFKNFPVAYQELRTSLQIEHYRLELWGKHMLSDHQQQQVKTSPGDVKLWKLFHSIFQKILDAFSEGDQAIGRYGDQGTSIQDEGLAGEPDPRSNISTYNLS